MAKKTDQRTFQAKVKQFVEALKEDIASGVYRPGDFLPSEETLSRQFDLSNRSIRHGLDQLVQEGLIVKQPRVGNRVASNTIVKVAYRDSLIRDVEFERLLALFHTRYPTIRIQLVRTGVFPSFADGMTPYLDYGQADIVLMNHFDFRDMLESGRLDRLEPVQPIEGGYDKLNGAFQADGVQYALPFLYSPVVLCYNPEHFREVGVNEPVSGWTWDDLRFAAGKLSGGGRRIGFFYHLLSINRWLVFLLQNGIQFTQKNDGGYEVDLPLLMDSFRFSRDLLFKSNGIPVFASETEEEVMQIFREGRASMLLATYFSLNDLIKDNIAFEIAPLPQGKSDQTLLLTTGWAINRASNEKEAALQFVHFLSSPEAQDFVRHTSLSLPALKVPFDSARDECVNRRPSRFDLHHEIASTYRLHSELMFPLNRLYALRNALKLYWFGLKDETIILEEVKALLAPDWKADNESRFD
ncbi:extracellular solute-binding protein [Paenibacillus antri]|nr:extracellular solute-binding protein [Paenibacillus antri]